MQPCVDATRTQINSADLYSKDNSGNMWSNLFSVCNRKGSSRTPVFPVLEGRSRRGKAGRHPITTKVSTMVNWAHFLLEYPHQKHNGELLKQESVMGKNEDKYSTLNR